MNNITQLDSPVKADSDSKQYMTIRLANGLTACLVSDVNHLINLDDFKAEPIGDEQFIKKVKTEEDKDEKFAACSLTVGVGSFSDPQNVQGLAHFLEHMLFMGNEKYPKENALNTYISNKGGWDDAATECDYTTYYFECQEKHLLAALDIFSNSFISPLLKKKDMVREREAVESEFHMSLHSEDWRRKQLICSMAHDDNPAKKFIWGNKSTLKDSITDDELNKAVCEFWKRHYSAHRMTLAVQARLPMDILKEYVVKCFSGIPNNSLPPIEYPILDQPFIPEKFNNFYRVESIQEMSLLELNWVLPSVIKLYKSKPSHYISWIIGHEGEGSLTAYLRDKLWITSLSSGHTYEGLACNSMYTLFSITVNLSYAGKANVDNILKAIFSYIKMLQIEGPKQHIFQESQAIDEMYFRFSEETTAVVNVHTISENMQFYPPADYIAGYQLTYEYKPELITEFLNLITPENANIIFHTHDEYDEDIAYDYVEPWFKARYTYDKISNDFMDELKSIEPYPEFHLPKPNEFIATDFTLLPEDTEVSKYPELCLSTDVLDVYYRGDIKFRLPIGFVGINIVTPLVEDTAKNSALTLLYLDMLELSLVNKTYPASVALLEHSFTTCERGLCITVYGFTHKLHRLLECIIEGIKNFNDSLTEELFETYKKITYQGLTNVNLDIDGLSNDIRMSLLLKKHWTSFDKFYALLSANIDDVKLLASELYKEVRIQCLVQGNFNIEQAKTLCTNFVQQFEFVRLPEEKWPNLYVYQIPLGEKYCRVRSFNYEDKNCLTLNYYQYGPATIKEYSLAELVMMLMDEPLFDKLRTKQQLGYDISCLIRNTCGILGFTIAVYSQIDKYTMTYVEMKITEFLNDFVKKLKRMPQKDFIETQQSLVKIKQCVDTQLVEEIDRNWDEITSCEYVFDRLEKEINYINSFTKDDAINFLKDYTLKTSNKSRKLSIQIVGHENNLRSTLKRETIDQMQYHFLGAEDNANRQDCFIKDFTEFKENLPLYPQSKIV